VLCMPGAMAASDPDSAETACRDVELATSWTGTPAGVVGFAEGGWDALRIAAAHGELVSRIEMVPGEGREILARVWPRVWT
jgi:hypothetical protein